MKIVTAAEMSGIDDRTIREYGIPGSVLMERAGLAVARKVQEVFSKKKVVVLSGGGNNGGDGIVAARTLHGWGWHVKVLLMLREDRLSPDCLSQYRIAKGVGVPVEFRTTINDKDLHGAIVIDALLGTGINKPVVPPMSDVIRFLNSAGVPVVSVDIPSGISSDTGQVMGEAVRATCTVTFGLAKIGHHLFPGAEFSGAVSIEDIGFPHDLLVSDNLKTETFERSSAAGLLPERPRSAHKGDFGHVLVVAGSRGKTGAALLAARACLRSGAGRVTIGVPETLADIFQSRANEEMILPLKDRGDGVISEKAASQVQDFLSSRADVLALGPGLTADKEMAAFVSAVLSAATVPSVIDADGLNTLAAAGLDILKQVKAPIVLTPHPGEMARLLKGRMVRGPVQGASREETVRKEIGADRLSVAADFSRQHSVYLVLKGAPTVIAEPEGRSFLNTTGNPGMATAGTGDVLTGVIAGLFGQGLNPLQASLLGTYLHGHAADIAVLRTGMHALIASDIIDALGPAMLDLANAEPDQT